MVSQQDCILVTPDSTGYARWWVNGKAIQAHRFAYEESYGPIPEGLEVDHLCYQTNCINPQHLEAVTHQENCRRARHKPTRKTGAPATGVPLKERSSCPQGHPYSGDNLYVYPNGARRCNTCRREQLRQFRLRKSQVAR